MMSLAQMHTEECYIGSLIWKCLSVNKQIKWTKLYFFLVCIVAEGVIKSTIKLRLSITQATFIAR